MKKKLLLLFFIIHLSLVFFQGFGTTIKGYWDYHFDDNSDINILQIINPRNNLEPYYQLSGINTGYGFYGIKTATQKYFRITLFNSDQKKLNSDRYFKLTTSNGVSRLEGFASKLANTIAEGKKIEEQDTLLIKNDLNLLQFKKDYVLKVLKWMGKQKAKEYEHCDSYKIELLAIIPSDVRDRKIKPELYVVQESTYPVQ